jgi:hypothetical protein
VRDVGALGRERQVCGPETPNKATDRNQRFPLSLTVGSLSPTAHSMSTAQETGQDRDRNAVACTWASSKTGPYVARRLVRLVLGFSTSFCQFY